MASLPASMSEWTPDAPLSEWNICGRGVRLARLQSKPRPTQNVLATELQLGDWDIDHAGIEKTEIGLREATDVELLGLAEALNVPACWLLGESGS